MADKKRTTSKKSAKSTPLMKQYRSIKAKYPDALLLFRVGDFYETFAEDAVKTASILDIVLTKRGAGSPNETALAGFPYHALNTYLPKLVKAGLRVAICEQLEDPKLTKGIVKRGVTEMVTPGVSLHDEVLNKNTNNFLAAVHYTPKNMGIAFIDVSTGEFFIAQGDKEYTDKLLQNFQPKEVLVSKKDKKNFLADFGSKYYVFYLEDWVFQYDFAFELLTDHFKTRNLKGFGIQDLKEGIIASGVCLHYIRETRHDRLDHIRHISRIDRDTYVWMDKFTVRNLEIFPTGKENHISLSDIINHSLTPMGSRMMHRWLSLPLKDIEQIRKRHEMVKFLLENTEIPDLIRDIFKSTGDLERWASKIATGRIHPGESVRLGRSLKNILPLLEKATDYPNSIFRQWAEQWQSCTPLTDLIDRTLVDEPPVLVQKGNVIRKGVSEELDALREIAYSGKSYLDQMLQRESERTGIPSLKISFNNVFGYYIEVRNTHKDKVPEDWIRKQTLVSAERYITPELKEYEAKILGAEEKIAVLEQQLYTDFVRQMLPYVQRVQGNARLLGRLDVLNSFAHIARQYSYVRPEMDESTDLEIKKGRHPVIERQLPHEEPFIANDLYLNRMNQQIIMITGPNMSGKSAILRQTALIVLLAQIGSYVPAEQARIGVVDKIFTRVGASDNISMGESTFMVEMNETASILHNITEKSLILLDEIGRGTSTYDGISIAWAIAEYLHEHPYRPKTLFATHYHELNDMAESFERIKNFNVSVKELKDKVIFLRKLVPGGSQHSFGIYVAKLAGMPVPVIHKAEKILKRLEESHSKENTRDKLHRGMKEEMQLSFFQLDDPLLEEIRDEILSTNIDALTPIEALMKLNEIKRMLTRNSKS